MDVPLLNLIIYFFKLSRVTFIVFVSVAIQEHWRAVIPSSFMPELRLFTQSQDQAIQGAPRKGGAGFRRERRFDSPALTKCPESQTNCERAHSSPVALHRPLAAHENSSRFKFSDGSRELMRRRESARERTKAIWCLLLNFLGQNINSSPWTQHTH